MIRQNKKMGGYERNTPTPKLMLFDVCKNDRKRSSDGNSTNRTQQIRKMKQIEAPKCGPFDRMPGLNRKRKTA